MAVGMGLKREVRNYIHDSIGGAGGVNFLIGVGEGFTKEMAF